MKAIEQYVYVELLIMLYKVVLTFKSVDEAFEQYFYVALSIMLYKVVLTFKSVDETLSVTIQMKATEQYFYPHT